MGARIAAGAGLAAAAIDNPPGGSFAFVMATGIVSIVAEQQGFHRLAVTLFAINAIAFVLLAVLSLLRLVRTPTAMFGELSHHETGAGFLTSSRASASSGTNWCCSLRFPAWQPAYGWPAAASGRRSSTVSWRG
jgi:tellurite resistance protein TehA-like permease